MENFKRPNKLSMVTTLVPDEGTSSAKKEAPKPVVVITGLCLFEQLFIIKKF